MAFAALVVEQCGSGQRLAYVRFADLARVALGGEPRRGFEHVERSARIALCAARDQSEALGARAEPEAAQPSLCVVERALEQRGQVLLGQRRELEHACPRQQRRVDRKGWIFGGGPDQRDRAVFHVRQQRVLLRLVEAVDLVDEQQRRLAVHALLLGGL